MYTLPSEFAVALDEMFHGRFRIRWSDKRQEFHLEQKVGAGQILIPPPIDPDAPDHFDTYSDAWIRARDGYVYVMSLRNGSRMPCPICGLTVDVPIMETRESICPFCRVAGRDGRYVAAYYPFNHILLQHIRDIDPYFDTAHHIKERMRAREQAWKERRTREEIDRSDYAVINNKTQIEDNAMVGYGPTTVQHTYQRFYDAGQDVRS